MRRSLKVAKNTTWLVTAKLASRVLTALFIILLANHLLPRSFGIYNFAMALSYVATVVADFGFDELTIREVSRDGSKGPEILGDVLVLRVFLGLLTISFLLLLHFLVFKDTRTDLSLSILLVAASMILIEKISGSFIAQFQALQKMELQAITTILSKSVYLVLGIAAIFMGFELLNILLFLLVSYLFNLVISFLIYFKSLKSTISRPQSSRWIPMFKQASPFTFFIFTSMIYGHVIILLLSTLEGDFATGVYSASWKIIVFFGVIPYSFGRALYPVFSQYYHSSRKVMQKTYRHSLRYLLLFSLPLTLGLYVIGGDILQLIYRSEFSSTVPAFKTIVWVLPFLFMNGSLKMALWGSDRTKESTKNLAFASAVLIVSGVLTIPRYGVVGAAASIVIAELVHFLANYRIVTSYLGPIPPSDFWRPYICSLVMAAFLYSNIYFELEISSLLLLPPAVILYFVVLYLLKGIQQHDIEIMKGLIGIDNN